MIRLTCAPAQIDAQLTRHRANAIMRALHRGPLPDVAGGSSWRTRVNAPNARVTSTSSPVMADLLRVQKRIDDIERLGERTGGLPPGLKADLQRLTRKRDGFVDEAKELTNREPEWPVVAGVYALHTPPALIRTATRILTTPDLTQYRVITLDDTDALWPVVKATLLKQPRGLNTQPARPFRLVKQDAHVTLQRDSGAASTTLADWLTATAAALHLDVLLDGDYVRPPSEPADPYAAHLTLTGDVL